jgi:hypothetical protein
MLESLIISSVFQSLPTIYPISIEQSFSIEQSSKQQHPQQKHHPQKKQKMKRRMERVKQLSLEKRAFPNSFFAKTVGIFDNMLCCRSYAEQQLYGEAQEREREYKEEESSGCGLDAVTERGNRDLRKIKKAAAVQETNNHRQYDYDFVDQRSPPQQHRKSKAACRTTGTRAAPCSPVGSSYSTATTVTANTYNTAEDSYSARSSSRSRSSNRSLRTTETNELFGKELSADQKDKTDRSLTNRTISVPSRSRRLIKLDPENRRWSEGCVEFEQQNADYYPYVPSEEVIRKVQSESLAELPYLSMTEGYRC